ncbi:MAG: acyl carrier protein [Clostridia bacterium]|jgi:acyl carrier protein|nr:acyl carrier protein [Clostridia bacterium]
MAPTRTEIIDRLKDILLSADERKRDVVAGCTEASGLMTDLGFSSVSMLYMVIAIEEEFGIRFGNVGASDFKTLGDVVDYIEARMK